MSFCEDSFFEVQSRGGFLKERFAGHEVKLFKEILDENKVGKAYAKGKPENLVT